MEQTMPDVVLMDIQMPGINGIEAVQIIKGKIPGVQVMMQTVFDSMIKYLPPFVPELPGTS